MILSASHLFKTYMRRDQEFNAVDDVDFFAWSGDFTVIFGESGSGKSTLLSLFAGISRPSRGSVFFDGMDLASITDEELTAVRNGRIGYVPQENVFLPQYTVLENILLPRAILNGKRIFSKDDDEFNDAEIFSWLEFLGVAHLTGEKPSELSGGELKRVSIVRSLVNRPDVVIADEPTSNLDESNSKKVFDLFSEIAQLGTSVIVATHDSRGIRCGDRLYSMHKGCLLPKEESDFGGL